MTNVAKTLTVRSAPHVRSGSSVDTIMFHVVLALLPVTAFAIYTFGLAALGTLAPAVLSCLATEQLLCRLGRQQSTLGDWSVTVTGLLYGLTLPPGLALWMVAVGGVFAVAVGKILFGGLGQNPFNPALVGRAFLQGAFPVAMTTWPLMPQQRFSAWPTSSLALPFTQPHYDAVSGATPLSAWKFDQAKTETIDLFLGNVTGSTGETSALLILSGGAYLVARHMMSWRIPVAIVVTVAVASAALHGLDPARYPGPLFMVCSGGLLLGAVFMATDPVASPVTSAGRLLYGVVIGLIVVVIRVWGGMPEGVMYAILLSNAVSPHIDNWLQPRVYGTSSRGTSHG